MTVEIGPMNATAVSDIHLTITIAIFDGRYLGKYTVILIDLKFYVEFNTKLIILETFFQPNY